MAGWCYLLKRSVADVATLERTIAGAAAGLVVLDPHVVAGRAPRVGGALAQLTPRQGEILAWIAQGFTNPAIAGRPAVASGTVENPVTQIYQELGLGTDQSEFNPRVLAVLLYLRGKCSAPMRCRAQRRGGSSVECRLAGSHQEIEQRPALLPRHGSGTR